MHVKIENFQIEELYGKRNYKIEFDNNQLIIVGENGSGKSTVISILHYFLTDQWYKLLEYDFKTLKITINDKLHQINKKDIENEYDDNYSSKKSIIRFVKLSPINVEDALSDDTVFRALYGQMRRESRIHYSPMAFRRVLKDIRDKEQVLFDESDGNLLRLRQKLKLCVLYLPTYRRIERDLKTIFPQLEESVQKYNYERNSLNYYKHLELVEFGMNDVRTMIENTMKSLDTHFRLSLDSLTGGYLRVILRKEYENTDVSILNNMKEEDLKKILQKIDKSVLSESDQKTLEKIIKRFANVEPISEIDKLSAHIITKLILLHKNQYEKEEKVRAFASVCNKYLNEKQFKFDDNNFSLPIKSSNDDEIHLRMLSSGEKQIVSLFSHLYLSDMENYFIIIDEPELSLSVPWQKSFLPDILASNKCSGLIAVTHSPFIYANSLEDKAHSIQEFLRITT